MKFLRASLVFAAMSGTLAAGVCQAVPTSVFGPIYPTVNNPCMTVMDSGAGKHPYAGFGEMVHFTIGGKVVSVLDKTGGTPRLKLTIETHGEGLGATTGAKYVFDGRMETTANAGANAASSPATSINNKTGGKAANISSPAAGDGKLQIDNIYKVSARIHSSDAADPARDGVTIEFPVKVSHADGMTVAWPLNAQDNIRLTCQAAP